MDESTKQIKEYIDKLPKPLQQAILSPEWHKRIGEIGQKYSLHLDQISSLEYEVLFVMIGMEPETDLVANIQRELPVSKILADELAEEVNTRIFQYILKSLVDAPAEKPARFTEVAPEPVIQVTEKPAPTPVTPVVTAVPTPTESLATPSPAVEPKTVPPPINLPTDHDPITDPEHELLTHNPTEDAPIVAPPTTPAVQVAQTLADVKLNSIVQTETQTATVTQDSKLPPVTYGKMDPYREPLI